MKNLFLTLLVPFVFTSCATLFDGGNDTLNIQTSNGSKVQAQITSKSGTQSLQIPAMVSVEKSCKDVTVQVLESEENAGSVTMIESDANIWTFANIILGGLIGLGIDAGSGNMCTYRGTNTIVNVVNKSEPK